MRVRCHFRHVVIVVVHVFRSGVGDSSRCSHGALIWSSASLCCTYVHQKVITVFISVQC